MHTTISKRFLPIFILFALPTYASSIGVYVSVSDLYAGDASYASGPGISIYNGGGLKTSGLTQYDTFSSSVSQPGATTASMSISSNVNANTQESSSSYASLASGIMRSQVATVTTGSSRAITDQTLADTATFTVNGAPSAQIQVNVHLDGKATGVGKNAGQETNDLHFTFGGSFQWEGYVSNNGSTGISHNGASGYVPPYGWDSYTFSNETVTGFDFVGLYTVTNGQTVNFGDDFSLDCSSGALCDFSNTSRFSLTLPSNVNFSSGSGVLLTQSPSATPEPGTMLLFIPALTAVVFAARRKKA